MYSDGTGTWPADTTLVISPRPLTLCDCLTVSTSGPAAEMWPQCLTEFSRTVMWWNGKPMFENSYGWLLYQGPIQGWCVGPKIGKPALRGSMAHHCPAREETWTYYDDEGSKYQPISVKIKCNMHIGKS